MVTLYSSFKKIKLATKYNVSFIALVFFVININAQLNTTNTFYIDSELEDQSTIKNGVSENSKVSNVFHLFTHGKSGQLFIDNAWLDAPEIVNWWKKQAVKNQVDHLNIYGCNFAKGEIGEAAVQLIETQLGITVAASNNITGKDGDWDLEVGDNKSAIAVKNYSHSLQSDTDGDGVPDSSDLDDDNDGITDVDECTGLNGLPLEVLNSSGESPLVSDLDNTSDDILASDNIITVDDALVPFWSSSNGNIEIWSNEAGGPGLDAFEGEQWFELNSNSIGAIFQDINTTPGSTLTYSFAHRGRFLSDSMRLLIGDPSGTLTDEGTFTTDNTAWVEYTGTYVVPAGQTTTRLTFESITPTNAGGNYLDNIQLSEDISSVACDTDGDTIPDFRDLDSDGDGCSDANEAYSNTNTDGGDGGVFGSGTPTLANNGVNANGLVISAGINGAGDDYTNTIATTASGNNAFQQGITLAITQNPSNQTTTENGSTTFSATATTTVLPTTPITTATVVDYQWQVSTNGGGTFSNISGESGTVANGTQVSLTLTNVGSSVDGNRYRMVASSQANICDTETSSAATLTVGMPVDTDGDGVPDSSDLDDDNDGITDVDECTGLNGLPLEVLNSSGESPLVSDLDNTSDDILASDNIITVDDALVPFWSSSNGNIEIWSNEAGGPGLDAFEGEQWFELNSNSIGGIFQDINTTPGSTLTYSFAHRGRFLSDTMRLLIGDPSGTLTDEGTFTTDNTAWVEYTGTYVVPAGQTITRLTFESITPTNAGGNYLDNIQLSENIGSVACDTDGDNIPDFQDLDSDGDGCSDANEAYNNTNADGGDGGTFGSGTPTLANNGVNANGLVISAGINGAGDDYTNTIATTASGDNTFQQGTTLAITQNPSSQTTEENSSVTFNATATTTVLSTTPITTATVVDYQWQVSTNGGGTFSNISGESGTVASGTQVSLTLNNVAVSANGNQYRMVASSQANICDTETSSAAILNVGMPVDTDGDGVPDNSDLDDDNDGITDVDECTALNGLPLEIINASGESPLVSDLDNTSDDILASDNIIIVDDALVPFWSSSNGNIEIWSNEAGGPGLDAFEGEQWFELNSNSIGAIFQDINTTPGSTLTYSFAHRGRFSSEVMRLLIGDPSGTLVDQGTFTTDNTAWVEYTGTYVVPAGQTTTRLTFESITPTNAGGNYLDNIQLSENIGSVACDTDGDNIPDFQDLDSDGDGCSDANEAYSNTNADGGDGGTFGSGTPTLANNGVNANGLVISAGINGAGDDYTNTIATTASGDNTFQQGVTLAIIQNPSSQTTEENTSVTFSATATTTVLSTTPITTATVVDYQWQVSTNGGGTFSNISGESGTVASGTQVSLTLTNVGSGADGNRYRMVASSQANICDTETSSAATLTVGTPVDTDGDGVPDNTDLDDDNDGITDVDECTGLNGLPLEVLNSSGESPLVSDLDNTSDDLTSAPDIIIVDDALVPFWSSSNGNIEIWVNADRANPTLFAFEGEQWFELNSNSIGGIFQDINTTPGSTLTYSFAHRGRGPSDSMRLLIGDPSGTLTDEGTFATDDTAWVEYTGTYVVPAGQTTTRLTFESITPNNATGNFLDNIQLSEDISSVACDTDGDNIPDFLDLDSDGDGCSDANEAYSNTNADGGDGGIFGTGTPTLANNGVNANGLVISAGVNGSGDDYTNTIATTTSGNNAFQQGVTLAITQNPSNQTITSPNSVTFNATATTTALPTTPTTTATAVDYQWQVSTNGGGTFTNIPGESGTVASGTEVSLTLNDVPVSADGNQYRMVASSQANICDTETSSVATLTVISANASIALVKFGTFDDVNGDGFAQVGERINYNFIITNTGDVTVSNITISDPLPGIVLSGGSINLNPGQNNTTLTATYTLTQTDIDNGGVSNQATATGDSPTGTDDVSDISDDNSNTEDDTTTTTFGQNPSISLIKTGVFNDVDMVMALPK